MEDNNFELSETLFYNGLEGAITAEFLVDKKNETLWASRKTVASIFGTTGQNISNHFLNIFEEEELNEKEVSINSKKLFGGQTDFSKDSFLNSKNRGRPEKWYNLDGIIAVGYRVNSKQATHFRIWATGILKEYLIKGFILDDELLKNSSRLGKDYFDELLERIREIRVSERRFYQKVADLYATAKDYNENAQSTKNFYANVQNKIIYAVTDRTAAEIIVDRADSKRINMGITNWKGSPQSKIHISDVIVSKLFK